jgi:hypothetical protein
MTIKENLDRVRERVAAAAARAGRDAVEANWGDHDRA